MHQMRFLKFIVLPFIILLLNSCSTRVHEYLVYVGTYTGKGSEGIYAYRFNPSNGDLRPIGLVAKTANPSFITIDPGGRFLYAVNEIDSFQNKPGGAVSVFAINRESGKLTLLQQVSSLGAAPAHLSLDKSGRYLMVANYNGGNAAVFPIGRDGKLGQHSAFIQNAGSGPNASRQAGPHAHFISVTTDNRYVMIADLGIDKVLEYRFNADNGSLTPVDSGFVKLDPGSGPRHIAFPSPGKFVYVLNELNSTVTGFSYEPTGMMHKMQTISTLPASFAGENTAAEITADANGRCLYVSNRGDNSIILFRINADDGRLNPVEWVSGGGKTPRSFAIDLTGHWLFVANQDSDNIVLFQVDQASGQLNQTSQTLRLISPVCINFLKNE
jgi:6-phosphogluconolactonase